ncbi:MAG: hypothetical protein J2P23_13335, partial [Microlunatus sp.]|nr:hypothetical protein [Microlunatus sp.]
LSLRHASPPKQLGISRPLPVPDLRGWYGNSALWVGVPPDGVLPAQLDPDSPGDWTTKVPWWRVRHGAMTVSAVRLDGPTGNFRATVGTVAEYGEFGLDTSELVWPSLGCWQVTATVARHSLTIVMRVQAVRSAR